MYTYAIAVIGFFIIIESVVKEFVLYSKIDIIYLMLFTIALGIPFLNVITTIILAYVRFFK